MADEERHDPTADFDHRYPDLADLQRLIEELAAKFEATALQPVVSSRLRDDLEADPLTVQVARLKAIRMSLDGIIAHFEQLLLACPAPLFPL